MMMGPLLLREYEGIGHSSSTEESYRQNVDVFDEARARALSDGDCTMASHAARGLAESLRRIGRLDDAERAYNDALRFFRAAGDAVGVAWTLFGLGNLYRQRSDFHAACAVLSEGLVLAKRTRNAGLTAYIMAGLAETRRIWGDYPQAFREHIAVFKLFSSLHDTRGIIWAIEGGGQILRNIGAVEMARRYFQRAKRLATSAHDVRGLAYAVKCHAECLSDLGEVHAAIEEASLAIACFDAIGLRVGVGYAHKALGDILSKGGDVAAARVCYRAALDIFDELADARGVAYTLTALAALSAQVDDASAAAAMLATCSDFFRRTSIRLGTARCERTFGVVRRLIGAARLYDVMQEPTEWLHGSAVAHPALQLVLPKEAGCALNPRAGLKRT